jgi:hypothetical protein
MRMTEERLNRVLVIEKTIAFPVAHGNANAGSKNFFIVCQVVIVKYSAYKCISNEDCFVAMHLIPSSSQ